MVRLARLLGRHRTTIALWCGALALLLGLRASVADHYRVPSGSMLPTVQIGDRVLVNKLAYGLRLPLTHTWLVRGAGPAVGDVVVLDAPDEDKVLLKRVVAVGGDTLEVRAGELILNGRVQPLERRDGELVELLAGRAHPVRVDRGGGPDDGPRRIPRGHVFLLGDNRGDSRDSRFFGPVPVERILGKAERIHWRGGPSWHDL
ncbi:MAG TPA: signal peptidase I [Gemmatimonadales bacterium]|nr:signal peptidase I [Gemmatimonadales bacterium]